MRYVKIDNLKVGDIVSTPIYNKDRTVLVNTGVVLTRQLLKRLSNTGLTEICIDDELSKGIDLSNVKLREIETSTIKDLEDLNLDNTLKNANKIVEEVKNSKDILEYLNPKTFDSYLYEHCVSVAIYSAMIGYFLGYKDEKLKNLVAAALLHDLGKRAVNPEILNKPEKLEPWEYDEVKKHCSFGFNLVSDCYNIPAVIKVSILQHHENEDGSGYPNGLVSNKIYKFAKIIHICDVFDALISERPYKKAQSPKDAMEYIISNSGTMFDSEYVDVFCQVVPVHKRGSIVKLNDGRECIVLKNYRGDIYRPDVRVLDTHEVIKLRIMHDLFIDENVA